MSNMFETTIAVIYIYVAANNIKSIGLPTHFDMAHIKYKNRGILLHIILKFPQMPFSAFIRNTGENNSTSMVTQLIFVKGNLYIINMGRITINPVYIVFIFIVRFLWLTFFAPLPLA